VKRIGLPSASRIPATDCRSNGTPRRNPSHCISPEYGRDDAPAKRQSGSTSTTTATGRVGIGLRPGLAAPLIAFLAVLNLAKANPLTLGGRRAYARQSVFVNVLSDANEASRRELEIREAEAAHYDERYKAQHGPWFIEVEVAVLRAALELQPSDVLMDFGSGTGRITRALAPFCRRVVAIDRSRQSLDVLRDRAKADGLDHISLLEADVTREIPVKLEATKAVCIEVLQHIPSPEGRQVAVENIRRSLVRGGRCAIVNEAYGAVRRLRGRPRGSTEKDALFFHSFVSSELRRLVESAGLRPRRVLGCGVLYWTRYRPNPRVMVKLDTWASFLPGADTVAKFSAIIGEKS